MTPLELALRENEGFHGETCRKLTEQSPNIHIDLREDASYRKWNTQNILLEMYARRINGEPVIDPMHVLFNDRQNHPNLQLRLKLKSTYRFTVGNVVIHSPNEVIVCDINNHAIQNFFSNLNYEQIFDEQIKNGPNTSQERWPYAPDELVQNVRDEKHISYKGDTYDFRGISDDWLRNSFWPFVFNHDNKLTTDILGSPISEKEYLPTFRVDSPFNVQSRNKYHLSLLQIVFGEIDNEAYTYKFHATTTRNLIGGRLVFRPPFGAQYEPMSGLNHGSHVFRHIEVPAVQERFNSPFEGLVLPKSKK